VNEGECPRERLTSFILAALIFNSICATAAQLIVIRQEEKKRDSLLPSALANGK